MPRSQAWQRLRSDPKRIRRVSYPSPHPSCDEEVAIRLPCSSSKRTIASTNSPSSSCVRGGTSFVRATRVRHHTSSTPGKTAPLHVLHTLSKMKSNSPIMEGFFSWYTWVTSIQYCCGVNSGPSRKSAASKGSPHSTGLLWR